MECYTFLVDTEMICYYVRDVSGIVVLNYSVLK